MKLFQKKKNNKGFSLVELIVVVAIMAVLVGVLAPAYLSYVEKSRLQKDNSAIAEVCAAIQTAAADEDCYDELGTTAITIAEVKKDSITYNTSGAGDISAEVTKVVSSLDLTSKTYTKDKAATDVLVTIKAAIGSDNNVTISVEGYKAETNATSGATVNYPAGF